MRALPSSIVFTRADLRSLGWSDPAITRAVRSFRLASPRRGLFCRLGDIGPSTDMAAAALACAGSAVSHRSALALHGLPIVGPEPSLPEITAPPRRIGRVVHAHLHRAGLDSVDLRTVRGVPVTSVARALIDVGRSRPFACSVSAIDSALNRGMVTTDELDRILRRCWNWPGIRRAQRAVDLSDGLAESPLESVSRLVLVRLGLPHPRPQRIIRDHHGRFAGRVDFYWDEFGVVGEADGRSKYDDRDVLTDEKQRQERLEDLGLVVVRWGWQQTTSQPLVLKRRIERAFERGRLRDRSGSRRLWSVEPG